MNTAETASIYGSHIEEMEQVRVQIRQRIDTLRDKIKEEDGMDPIEHCLSRIKSEDSMRENADGRGFRKQQSLP